MLKTKIEWCDSDIMAFSVAATAQRNNFKPIALRISSVVMIMSSLLAAISADLCLHRQHASIADFAAHSFNDQGLDTRRWRYVDAGLPYSGCSTYRTRSSMSIWSRGVTIELGQRLPSATAPTPLQILGSKKTPLLDSNADTTCGNLFNADLRTHNIFPYYQMFLSVHTQSGDVK